jgi:hypothetical protein
MAEKTAPRSIESEQREILDIAFKLYGKTTKILCQNRKFKSSLAKPYLEEGIIPVNGIRIKSEDGIYEINLKRSRIQSFISVNRSTPSEWQSFFISFHLNLNGTAASADINYYDFSGLKRYTGLNAVGKVNELLGEIK